MGPAAQRASSGTCHLKSTVHFFQTPKGSCQRVLSTDTSPRRYLGITIDCCTGSQRSAKRNARTACSGRSTKLSDHHLGAAAPHHEPSRQFTRRPDSGRRAVPWLQEPADQQEQFSWLDPSFYSPWQYHLMTSCSKSLRTAPVRGASRPLVHTGRCCQPVPVEAKTQLRTAGQEEDLRFDP